jgi:hypothetical protein
VRAEALLSLDLVALLARARIDQRP